MIAPGQEPEDALDGLGIRVLAHLKDFIKVHEFLFAHRSVFRVVGVVGEEEPCRAGPSI
jgi:hypothetical protein